MIGQRMKERREALGLTLAELGERLKLEPQAVHRYEKGLNDPRSELVARIAIELGVTADWLLGLVDEPNSRLMEKDLSETERRLIDLLRSGQITEAIRLTLDDSQHKPKAAVPIR